MRSKSRTERPSPVAAGFGHLLQTLPLAGGTQAGGASLWESQGTVPVRRLGVKQPKGTEMEESAMGKAIHVVPYGDQWAWRREHSERVSGVADTQTEATGQARQAAQRDKVELYVHRPDGRIRERDSHGHDPYPPKG
jgi:hypothetical protein